MQIYTRTVVVHFSFLFFFVFPKDKDKWWMMVIVQRKRSIKKIKNFDILIK